MLALTAVFSLLNLPCCATWLGMGSALKHYLDQARYLRIFNRGMAALLLQRYISRGVLLGAVKG